MITELKLPELGENIESGNVVKVLVKAGDTIEKDQPVLELETDKATIEVPSSVNGVVREVRVQEGGKAQVGQVVLTVDSTAGQSVVAPDAEVSAEAAPIAPVQEKSTVSASESVPIQEKPAVEQLTEPVLPPPPPQTSRSGRIVPASPSVRRLAREIGVDIAQVAGTGQAGRISITDVKAHAKKINEGMRISGTVITPPLPDFSKWGQIERKPMSGIRLKTAQHMSTAWTNVPQVTQYDKADTTELEIHRKRFGEKAEAAGGKLTVTAILLKVAASALKAFPQFNTSVDMAGGEIVYKKYIHVGVAVDTERGLLVPVIRDVDEKNILQISIELAQAAEKARNKKLSLEEMQGGTFTITNLGGIGGTYFSPIVNFPEVAILGVSRGGTEPVYRDGKFEPRTMLPLSLSYDHRVIDGADAARFLRWICEALQDPFLLALEG